MKTGNSINIPEKNKDVDEDKKDKDTDKGTRGKNMPEHTHFSLI